MINFLIQKCLAPGDAARDGALRARAGTVSGVVGIVCNLLLFAGKLFLGILAGSVSITADALNNLSDASGSILTLVGFRLAGKPADDRHPYGHARFEYLSGLAISAMILLIGFELAQSSLAKILSPRPVEFTPLAAGILAASIAVKLWLAAFNRKLGRAIQSTALLATAQDSRNDCIATGAVLLAGLLESIWDLRLDGWMGLGVAVFIFCSGWGMAKQTISPLLGENADPELRQRIAAFVCAHPKVLGYHDLMVHDYGPGKQYASLHVEMDSREDPLHCHEIIDRMEYACLRKHNVHLVIHYDPVVTDDPELQALKDRVSSLLQQQDPRLSLHDFRMVPGKRHMNLIFDVALPRELQGKEDSICRGVEDALNAAGPMVYHVRITFDQAAFS